MASHRRAVRAARELVQRECPRIPVPVEQIAQKHARVIRRQLPSDISGMLVPLSPNDGELEWAIVVNDSDAPVRQRFTIAHELGHLLIHRYSTPHADGRLQVRFRDEESRTGSVQEEIEANQFAAELLMPKRHVMASLSKLRYDVSDPSDDPKAYRALRMLATRFGVSVQAFSFRIANLMIA